MATLKINYDQLEQLKSLPQKLKNNVIRKSIRTSIFNARKSISEFAFKKLEQSRLVKFDRNVQKKRITMGKVSEGYSFDTIHGYIRFATINESLSSFPWQKTKTFGTNGKTYPSFTAQVLGRTIKPMPKTFISKIKLWSVKRTSTKSTPLKKAYLNGSSVSDLLRYDNELMNSIIARANRKYESEIQRNIRWNLINI